MRLVVVCCVSFGLTLGVFSGVARGDVVLVMVEEDDPVKRVLVTEAAEQTLSRLGWSIPLDAKEREDYVKQTLWCGDSKECFSGAAAHIKADNLLLVTLQHGHELDGAIRIVVKASLIDGKDGQAIHSQQQFCVRCNDQSLAQAVAKLTEKIHYSSRSPKERESTFLTIETSPANVRVQLEGPQKATVSSGTYGLKPGEYRVTATADGYVPVVQAVGVPLGQTRRIHVQLAMDVEKQRSSQLRYWKWAALGAGGAALALGIRWIVVDESEVQNGVRQPEYTDTMVRGVISVGVGAALAATGYLLWSRDRTTTQMPSKIQIGLVPHRQRGGLVTVHGGF